MKKERKRDDGKKRKGARTKEDETCAKQWMALWKMDEEGTERA